MLKISKSKQLKKMLNISKKNNYKKMLKISKRQIFVNVGETLAITEHWV